MRKEISKKYRSKKEVSYLLTMLLTFVVFLCSCEPEELLQVPNSDATGKIISGIDRYDYADTVEVDTIIVDTIRDESLLDLNGLGISSSQAKPNLGDYHSEEETIEGGEEKEKEDLIAISELMEVGDVETIEIENPVDIIVETSPVEAESFPGVYIHVKWGCNGNDSVIELIEEHTDHPEFDGISYEWTSDSPFSNSITTSNYALLSYIEPEVEEEYTYNVSLNISTNTFDKTFDFCFLLEGNEIINCGEDENMMTTACGVGLQALQAGIEIAFKAGKSSCYFFPVKPEDQN